MKNIKEKIISILKKGSSLANIGVNNWAFSKIDALKALDEFEALQASIWGGDVCELTNGIIRHNYDNWHFEKLPNETNSEFSKRSIEKTREYIENYNEKGHNKIFFVFTIKERTE